MNDDIDKLREIFTADDVDEETRADNLSLIRDWEQNLNKLKDFANWQEHPITESIVAQAKKAYIDHSLLLARSRELTEAARFSLWGKQDAAMWLISLASKDVVREKRNIEEEIKRALQFA